MSVLVYYERCIPNARLFDGVMTCREKTMIPLLLCSCHYLTLYLLFQQECDEFALRSQQTWQKADAEGVFDLEMAPVEVPGKKGSTNVFSKDEHLVRKRPWTKWQH
jgi:hypothetical protein